MTTERTIPINVPKGWRADKWAAYCRHVARTMNEASLHPTIAKEWTQAALFSDRVYAAAEKKAS